jgi:CcmD family protein
MTTPDTSSYMIAGYAISFVVIGLYLVSLFARWKNLSQDEAMLEELETK